MKSTYWKSKILFFLKDILYGNNVLGIYGFSLNQHQNPVTWIIFTIFKRIFIFKNDQMIENK